MPCSRITRATRLWLTRPPAEVPSFGSQAIRGAPQGCCRCREQHGSVRPAPHRRRPAAGVPGFPSVSRRRASGYGTSRITLPSFCPVRTYS